MIYEGGMSLENRAPNTPAGQAPFAQANEDPRMEGLFRDWALAAQAIGVKVSCVYASGCYKGGGTSGYWGQAPSWDATPDQSPKDCGLRAALATNPTP